MNILVFWLFLQSICKAYPTENMYLINISKQFKSYINCAVTYIKLNDNLNFINEKDASSGSS